MIWPSDMLTFLNRRGRWSGASPFSFAMHHCQSLMQEHSSTALLHVFANFCLITFFCAENMLTLTVENLLHATVSIEMSASSTYWNVLNLFQIILWCCPRTFCAVEASWIYLLLIQTSHSAIRGKQTTGSLKLWPNEKMHILSTDATLSNPRLTWVLLYCYFWIKDYWCEW